jgi:zinc-finger-containing domain
MLLYCCGCEADVDARLTDGREVYPHRADLAEVPFWRCDACGNHVGCHHKTKDRTRPLGNIPTQAIRSARQHIHRVLDPLWRSKRISRKQLYARISAALGYHYHTAQIRTVEEARRVYAVVLAIAREAPA